jgi:hypothetical protein
VCISISREVINSGLSEYKQAYDIARKYQKTKALSRQEALEFLKHRWGMLKLPIARQLYNDSRSEGYSITTEAAKDVTEDLLDLFDSKYQQSLGITNTMPVVDAAFFIKDLADILKAKRIGLMNYEPYLDFLQNMESLDAAALEEAKGFQTSPATTGSNQQSETLLFDEQSRMTSSGDLVRGGGISVKIFGPINSKVDDEKEFRIEVKPGDPWITQSGAMGKPKDILGEGMSQLLVLSDKQVATMSSPSVTVDGWNLVQLAAISLINQVAPTTELPYGPEQWLWYVTRKLLDSFTSAARTRANDKPTSMVVGPKPDLGTVGNIQSLNVTVGGTGVNEIVDAVSLVVTFKVRFHQPGTATLLFVPDVRAEAIGLASNNGITSTISPVMFEYRENIPIHITVDNNRFDFKNATYRVNDNIMQFRDGVCEERFADGTLFSTTRVDTVVHVSADQYAVELGGNTCGAANHEDKYLLIVSTAAGRVKTLAQLGGCRVYGYQVSNTHVVEQQPRYTESDANCCPSFRLTTVYRWDGRKFVVEGSSEEREPPRPER